MADFHFSPPPPGEGAKIPVLATRSAPEVCKPQQRKTFASKQKGGGAPKGASSLESRRTGKRCRLPVHRRQVYAVCVTYPRTRQRAYRSPLAFRRSAAALVGATERSDSAQAVLHANERTQALPAPSVALKRSTPRAGRNPGGNDAQAAREWGYKPRPQEPHSPHPTAVTGRRP